MSFELQQTQEKRTIVKMMALNNYRLKAKLSLHITLRLFIIFPFLILEKKEDKLNKDHNALIAIFGIAKTKQEVPGGGGVVPFLTHPLAMASEWMFTVAFC
jgi:hypothetical protein